MYDSFVDTVYVLCRYSPVFSSQALPTHVIPLWREMKFCVSMKNSGVPLHLGANSVYELIWKDRAKA